VNPPAVRPAPRYALRAALVVVVALLCWTLVQLSDPTRTPHDDFISSWAAGRLNAEGRNPYDPDQVLAVQRTAGWMKENPYRIWYPPWTIALLAPFGVLPYGVGRLLWYAVNIAACVASAGLLWRYYGGDPRARAMAWLILATFWPALIDIRTGQISAFVLLGLAGFLHFERARRWTAAGACLPLVATKPVLLHLVWIAILLWVIAERRWRVLVGAVGATLGLLALALAFNPSLIAQFAHMAMHDVPTPLVSAPGTLLRLLVAQRTGHDAFWLQFVPPLASVVWLAWRWWRRAGDWQWQNEMPVLLIASLLTTAYGWIYDDIVLLVPVTQVAVETLARRTRTAPRIIVASYLLVNATVVAMNVVNVDAFWYIWVPLAFAAWYAVSLRRRPPPIIAFSARRT